MFEFPVVIKDTEDAFPNDDFGYIVTKSGVKIWRNTNVMRSITKYKGKISHLKEEEDFADMNTPMMDSSILHIVTSFFRDVYIIHNSESVVLIHYNPKTKEYYIEAPKQEVGHSSVHKYDSTFRQNDFLNIGTIHSHSNFGAFHSGTDVKDEECREGLHITIGNVDDDEPTICASVVAKKKRFPKCPYMFFQGVEFETYELYKSERIKFKYDSSYQYNVDWLDNVEKKQYQYKSRTRYVWNKKKGKIVEVESKISNEHNRYFGHGYDDEGWWEGWHGHNFQEINRKDIEKTEEKEKVKLLEDGKKDEKKLEKVVIVDQGIGAKEDGTIITLSDDFIDNEVLKFMLEITERSDVPMDIIADAEQLIFLKLAGDEIDV